MNTFKCNICHGTSLEIKLSKAFLKVWERQHTKIVFLPARIKFHCRQTLLH